jgi:hypothetical protein
VWRSISYSEITRAATCQAQHAFAYTGWLTGGQVLSKRELAPILSDGRAWGAAIAAWHATHSLSGATTASLRASEALLDSYAQDRLEQAQKGWYGPVGEAVERRARMQAILEHYQATAQPFANLTRVEGEIEVPILARRSRGHSNKYRFKCFIDGYTVGELNHQWIAEFKLRASLQDAEQVMLSRQPRWYGWALRELQRQQGLDAQIVGVIVDERLNQPPKPPRILANGMPSHAKDQLCTIEDYFAVCAEFDVEPNLNTGLSLRERRWQQRIPIAFRDGELDEAAQELVSAAKLIHQLDAGQLYPIRNAKPSNCRGCAYRRICANPGDHMLVDSLYVRMPPKRDRQEVAA